MQWNRSNTIGLAKNSCSFCQGHGMRVQYRVKQSPCGCVLRSVFRTCLRRFRECAVSESLAGTVSWDYFPRGGRRVISRKKEEFMADFYLISRRELNEFESRVLRFYFLLGADWRLCTRRLGVDRGTFFHTVYRIEEKLGRAFAETEPYALFPLSDYFGSYVRHNRATTAFLPDPSGAKAALRVPMLLSA